MGIPASPPATPPNAGGAPPAPPPRTPIAPPDTPPDAGDEPVDDTPVDEPADEPGDEAEGDEAPGGAGSPADPAEPSIVDRLFGGRGEIPEDLAELVAEQDEAGEYEFTPEQWDALPIEAKQLVAIALHRGRKAKAELEDQRRAQATAERMAAQREARARQFEQDAFKWARSPKLEEFLTKSAPTGPMPDPSTPEGVAWLAQRQAHEMLKGWLKTIQDADAEVSQATQQASQQAAVAQQREELKGYIQQHADDFKTPAIVDAIKKLREESKGALSVQRCHELVMANLVRQSVDDQDAAVKEARRRVRPGGRGGRPIPELPKGLTTEEELAWYERHPEAEARDFERAERELRLGKR